VSEPTGSTDLPDHPGLDSLGHDPLAQDPLGLIQARLESSNPELYRHLALYLQVLREILPDRVRQACFHLATQVHPQRYASLPPAERHHLHRRIGLLVNRCGCLLTVEQLASLAAQMERERHRQPLQRPSREGLPGLVVEHDDQVSGDQRPGQHPEELDPSSADLPAGSVRLEISPPLTINPLAWTGAGSFLPSDPLGHGGWMDGLQVGPMAEEGDGTDGEGDSEEEESDDADLSSPATDQTLASPWLTGDLPKDPLTLLRWIEGMEGALTRRLRNLSHALNVEMLRAGLSQGLLPVNLLDAVLEGQLDPDAAPANLLRLQLPFPARGGDAPLQAMAVLLRCSDLELEEPRLRTCRRRLQQHRQEVRRMARQFRLLQRRLQSREAERLWLQDSNRMGRSDT
jgi:hypothetical protein